MTSSVRYSTIANTTGAALTTYPVVQGQDYCLYAVDRTLVAADVGTNPGQTRDNAGGGAPGCLIGQFQGAIIKDVLSLSAFRPVVAGGRTFYQRLDGILDGAAGHQSLYEWTLSNDSKSLYIFDLSANAASYLVAGDRLTFVIVLGNS